MNPDIGERIRKLREVHGLSLDYVSEVTGVSRDRLVALEEGRDVPSIGLVIKIARILGSRMGVLLHEPADQQEGFSICRAGDAQRLEEPSRPTRGTQQGYTYQTLVPKRILGQVMEPLVVTFDPALCQDHQPMAHQGQEFLYVLEGEVEFVYEGRTHVLKNGDSLYLDASRPHVFRSLLNTPARVLAVVCSGD